MKRRASLPLNALRAFEAAARLGRVTAAADALAVTHGAVSRQISQLEDYLGTELFEGPRNRPTLTPTGARLAAALTPAFELMNDAVRAIADDDGLLDVACLSTFAMRWLIPRLHRFQQQHPDIDVRLSTDERINDSARGRHDVVITALDVAAKPLAIEVFLFAEQLGVVLAPSLLAKKKPFALRDLQGVPRLATKTRKNAWSMWLAAVGGEPTTRPTKPPTEFEHYYFAIEAAANALGACAVPRHLVAQDVKAGRLVAPFGFTPSGHRYVALPRQPKTRKSSRFLDWLQQEARNQ